MSIESRLVALERKHKDLHSKIEALEAEKAPDRYIKTLKVEKLVVKDEMSIIQKKMLDGQH
tara:strand:- start:1718 stop:1900 length:183 start_codon:yes stop_codon:yes gene_type:complete